MASEDAAAAAAAAALLSEACEASDAFLDDALQQAWLELVSGSGLGLGLPAP